MWQTYHLHLSERKGTQRQCSENGTEKRKENSSLSSMFFSTGDFIHNAILKTGELNIPSYPCKPISWGNYKHLPGDTHSMYESAVFSGTGSLFLILFLRGAAELKQTGWSASSGLFWVQPYPPFYLHRKRSLKCFCRYPSLNLHGLSFHFKNSFFQDSGITVKTVTLVTKFSSISTSFSPYYFFNKVTFQGLPK